MADYTITLAMDPREALAGFRQMEQAAQATGQVIGQRLDQGVQRFSTTSLAGLQAELNRLQQRQTVVGFDTAAFDKLGQKIKDIRAKIAEVEQRRISIDAEPATNSLRLLDGVVQGVAFSLSNAVVNGAGQAATAIGGLVTAYAQLDTVIRQAAAASGGPGDYEKLAGTIDRVGIDAAGTSDQVAALSLELARGGMTADQQAQSLAGIVRGAEATATAYDRMGQIVSATLTSFGLDASETTRVVDALVQGANASATDVSGLGEAFKLSAPAAKLLGVNVEGLATAVGLFTNAGITASEAGTALRNGLSQLAQAAPVNGRQLEGLTGQAKMAADTVKQLGLDIYTASGQLKPMEQVLLQVKKAMAGLTAGQQTNLASRLFGGPDDAAKWLAVIGQSEEKIKAMAASMANAKGSTDRNRDAMQGFQLTVQQLTGTLDSLGKNIGKIAAGALLPLVQVANSVVGAVSGLPGPVKDTAIALGLLTGSVIAATTSYVVFKKVLAAGAISNTIREVIQLSTAFGGTLGAGIKSASAVIPGLITQLQLIGQLGIGQVLGAIGTAVKSSLVGAIESAKASLIAFNAYLRSESFATFAAGAQAATTAVLPFALAIAGVVAAYKSYEMSTETSRKIAEGVEAQQRKLTEALTAAGIKTGELTTLGGPLARMWQNNSSMLEPFIGLLRQIPGVGGFAAQAFQEIAEKLQIMFPFIILANKLWEEWRKNQKQADATQGIENANAALGNLQKQALQATDGARKLIGELSMASGTPTDKQVNSIIKTKSALNITSESAKELQDVLRGLAATQRNSGNKELADELEKKAVLLQNEISLVDVQLGQLVKFEQKVPGQITLSKEQKAQVEARIAAEQELNRVIAEAPARSVDNRIAVGQQLLSLAKSLAEADQGRFAIAKAQLDMELKQAQARGAGEGELDAIRLRIAANDRAALAAKLKALEQEQKLQQALLDLEQRKAVLQAQSAINQQKVAVENAQRALDQANSEFTPDSEQARKATAELKTQQEILESKRDALALLQQTQPLERRIAESQAQNARSALQATAAQNDFRIAADGSLVAINAVAKQQQRAAELTLTIRRVEQEVGRQRLTNAEALTGALQNIGALEQSRFSVVRAGLEYELQQAQARGASEQQIDSIKQRIAAQDRAALDARYQQLQREQQLEMAILMIKQQQELAEAKRAVKTREIDLLSAQAELQRAISAGDTRAIQDAQFLVQKQQILLQGEREKLGLVVQGQQAERAGVLLKQGAADNAIRAEQAAKGYAVAAEDTSNAFRAILEINQVIGNVLQSNTGLVSGLANNAEMANRLITEAIDGSVSISNQMMEASQAAGSIKSLNLSGEFSSVASSMGQATYQAADFYKWLSLASDLPGSRWTGGPVEAGGEYRINELGQEAFLSAGRLSLIDAAPNSIWRAPSEGVVIPAGITARLQTAGAVPVAAGSAPAGVAELAMEVGKLRQEVGNLARRDWSVRVTQRTGPTGSQVLRTLLS